MSGRAGESRDQRESAFWDAEAHRARPSLDPLAFTVRPGDRHDRSMPWLPYLGVPRLIETLLARVGDQQGKRVLEVGTGTGFLAVLLALNGAAVDAIDVSEAQLDAARERSRLSGVEGRVRFRAMAGDALAYPDATFDAVVGSFVLHHLDLPAAAPELARVLKPGGRAVFIETSGRNTLLMACRRTLTGRFGIEKHSSPDERPLDRRDEEHLEAAFHGELIHHDPILLFARALPSQVPFFRRAPLLWAARAADETLNLLKPLRRWSYFTVVELRRDGSRGTR